MTREEAIKKIKKVIEESVIFEDELEAFDIAIKALEHPEKNVVAVVPCGDAISREHLLEEIALLKKSPWFNENTYGSKVIRKEAVEIVEDVCIKREPSVSPQQRIGRWIDAEVLDKIRAEIDEQYDRVHPYDISCAEGLEMALGIIDKYKAEGSEG